MISQRHRLIARFILIHVGLFIWWRITNEVESVWLAQVYVLLIHRWREPTT